MWIRCCLVLLSVVSSVGAASRDADLATELSTRYAPYADWASFLDVDVLAGQSVARYWRTPQEIIESRAAAALPLSGLHLAIDPGHIGGTCAHFEGRHFRMAEDDFYVREGELVLEVARLVREQLQALGVQVTLLREANVRVNPKGPVDYLERAAAEVPMPEIRSFEDLLAYGQAVRGRAVRLSLVSGDLAERARRVNQVIRPDALVSLHINAAAWPSPMSDGCNDGTSDNIGYLLSDKINDKLDDFIGSKESNKLSNKLSKYLGNKNTDIKDDFISAVVSDYEPWARFCETMDSKSSTVHRGPLVEWNHLHALIFGCMSVGELQSARQQEQLVVKLRNGSGASELLLGGALATALADATGLPASTYGGDNAVLLHGEQPYLFARNLMLLRMAECPTVLLEPYVANSVVTYARIQAALASRAAGDALAEGDILVEYADAVVAGVLACYGGARE